MFLILFSSCISDCYHGDSDVRVLYGCERMPKSLMNGLKKQIYGESSEF